MVRAGRCLLFYAFAFLAAASTAAAQTTITITGTVTDSITALPIAGALIEVHGLTAGLSTTTTDANGQYNVPNLPAGQFQISAAKFPWVTEFFDNFQCRPVCNPPVTPPIHTIAAGTTFIANFALEPRAEITGTLVDANTLAPLASGGGTNFEAALYSTAGDLLDVGQTTASGQYRIINIDPGTYFLKVRTAPGYVLELHDNIVCIAADCPVTVGTPVSVTAGEVRTIDFPLARGGGISGAVRRSNGDPLPGLRVEVYNSSTSLVKVVTTGAGGAYSVDGLPSGSYYARVVPAEFVSPPTDLLFELYPNVLCAPTRPTPGAGCRITSGAPIAVVAGSTTAGIDFALDPAGSISGTLVAESGATPIPGQVTAYVGDIAVAQTSANASGQFTISGLAPGTYTVRTSVIGNYVNEWHNDVCVGCPGTPTPVTVASGTHVSGINFSLAAGGVITGTMTCPDGVTFPGVFFPVIYAYSAEGVLVRAAAATSPCQQGFVTTPYAIEGLSPGQYFLLARDTPGQAFFTFPRPGGGAFIDHLYGGTVCVTTDCDVRRAIPVNVPAGGVTGGINFNLTFGATGGGLAGTSPPLRMFDARGVELASVLAISVSAVFASQSLTGVPPGTYYVRWGDQLNGGIVCPDCPPTAGKPVVIQPGQRTFLLNFAASTDGLRISGTVRDESGGGPLSTITVQAYTDSAVLVGSAVTDLFGNYSIPSLQPGMYFLRTLNDRGFVDEIHANTGCASCDVRAGTPVVVSAADVTGIDFALAAGGVLAGKVADAESVVLANAPVSLFTAAGELAGRASTASDGQYRLTLPAGSYKARAEATSSHGAELYSELPCTSASCDLTTGTTIALSTGATTPNIDFTVASCTAMTMTPAVLASGVIGKPYRQVFTVSGGTPPIVFRLTAGALPAGVLFGEGLLLGRPTVAGRHEMTFSATDANGCATARAVFIDVHECAFTLSPAGATIAAPGGAIPVTINDGCGPQTVDTGGTFVTVQSNTSGQVVLQASVNSGAARSASITIGRRVFVVRQAGVSLLPPFGAMDSPADGSQVSGSLALGGWALDDLEVRRVQIFRDPIGGEGGAQIFLGDAVFVRGARPDVAAAYPTYPLNDRAGWGFLVLTNMLPNRGNGAFRIYAYADDAEGMRTLLGAKTIIAANAGAVVPFGAIDTPGQGATISGTLYPNFGWALSPQPHGIAFDGSTIHVIIDGMSVGHPVYNVFRADIAALFPGLINSGGPVGYKILDTTALAEGQHTIAWVVYNAIGAGAGIGSRYFNVANSADAQPADQGGVEGGRRTESLATASRVDDDVRQITLRPLERLELPLETTGTECAATWAGYLVSQNTLTQLPVGASIDPAGRFYWQPGPGFGGTFELMFVRTSCDGTKSRTPVTVTIRK